MRIGYKKCRGCHEETNCAELVSGYCPECSQAHVMFLSEYQRQYEAAVSAGEVGVASRVSELISGFEQSERLRLKDARREHSPGVKAK